MSVHCKVLDTRELFLAVNYTLPFVEVKILDDTVGSQTQCGPRGSLYSVDTC